VPSSEMHCDGEAGNVLSSVGALCVHLNVCVCAVHLCVCVCTPPPPQCVCVCVCSFLIYCEVKVGGANCSNV
jgi:hypothetical protein